MNFTIRKYNSAIVRLFLLIYVFCTFDAAIYKTIHLTLHLGDILSCEYTHHDHHNNGGVSYVDHEHPISIDQSSDENQDTNSIIVDISDKKVEYRLAEAIVLSHYSSVVSNKFAYIFSKYDQYLDSQLPPPKIS